MSVEVMISARMENSLAVTHLNEGLRARNPCNSNSSGRGVADKQDSKQHKEGVKALSTVSQQIPQHGLYTY